MIRSLALAPLVAAAALAPLAAVAAPGTPDGHAPAPLSTHLRYHHVSWHGTPSDPDANAAGVTVEAPRGWHYALTAQRQGRFTDPSGTWLMTATWPETRGTVRVDLKREVRRLQGTPGLHVQRRRVTTGRDRVTGTLVYTYTNDAGTTRWVSYEYQGSPDAAADKIVSVAGRPQDAHGLTVLRDRVVRTMGEAG